MTDRFEQPPLTVRERAALRALGYMIAEPERARDAGAVARFTPAVPAPGADPEADVLLGRTLDMFPEPEPSRRIAFPGEEA